jgi:4a-hydroxytetrahydrobiopterin dehydratase
MSDTVLSPEEIEERLKALPGWELRDGWIRRSYATPGWPHTLLPRQRHRVPRRGCVPSPDLNVGWAQVTVKLQTHSAKGITEKDFALAREIEAVATWLPAQGGPLEGFPKKWIR